MEESTSDVFIHTSDAKNASRLNNTMRIFTSLLVYTHDKNDLKIIYTNLFCFYLMKL